MTACTTATCVQRAHRAMHPYWRRTQHPVHAPIQAQDSASPDGSAANAAQLCKRLKELVARLDSVLPYLNLAISTVALLNQGGWVLTSIRACCYCDSCCPVWHLHCRAAETGWLELLVEVLAAGSSWSLCHCNTWPMQTAACFCPTSQHNRRPTTQCLPAFPPLQAPPPRCPLPGSWPRHGTCAQTRTRALLSSRCQRWMEGN